MCLGRFLRGENGKKKKKHGRKPDPVLNIPNHNSGPSRTPKYPHDDAFIRNNCNYRARVCFRDHPDWYIHNALQDYMWCQRQGIEDWYKQAKSSHERKDVQQMREYIDATLAAIARLDDRKIQEKRYLLQELCRRKDNWGRGHMLPYVRQQ
jgi:hypothetical protein